MNKEQASFINYFTEIRDPRIANNNKRYELKEILLLVILAVICGADSWTEIEAFGKSKVKFLRTLFPYKNGIPSHDTLGKLFSRLCPKEFQRCFLNWINTLVKVQEGEIVAIDGKTLRRSHNKSDGKAAIHLVSAWASQNQVVLGQYKTADKSNEITAIPELLKVLDLERCIVTIDAMGCQRKIAEQIKRQGAEYVLGVKANQGQLHQKLTNLFAEAAKQSEQVMWYRTHETVDGDHGRIEKRRTTVLPLMYLHSFKLKWNGLQSIVLIETERKLGEEIRREKRYYITSLEPNAEKIAAAIRQHWSIENQLHWTLDIAFREDECRVRKGNAAENLAIVRRIALNLLKAEKTAKVGIKIKRSKAGWDSQYLAKILNSSGF
ncbi:MAG TPA: ISAs1 family transposase [Candidatus Aquirickettsiella sp.]